MYLMKELLQKLLNAKLLSFHILQPLDTHMYVLVPLRLMLKSFALRNFWMSPNKQFWNRRLKTIPSNYSLRKKSWFLIHIEYVCRCFPKFVFVKFFAIFVGKHLCLSLFLIKLQAFRDHAPIFLNYLQHSIPPPIGKC